MYIGIFKFKHNISMTLAFDSLVIVSFSLTKSTKKVSLLCILTSMVFHVQILCVHLQRASVNLFGELVKIQVFFLVNFTQVLWNSLPRKFIVLVLKCLTPSIIFCTQKNRFHDFPLLMCTMIFQIYFLAPDLNHDLFFFVKFCCRLGFIGFAETTNAYLWVVY